MWVILLITVLFLCLVHLVFNYNEKARILRKIPGPPGHFIIGNALDILLPPDQLFQLGRKFAEKFNGIYQFWAFPLASINIYNAEDIEIILSNSKYNDKSVVYTFLKPWLRKGLLLSGGSKWQTRRKILTPAFHFNILRHFSEVLEDNSHRMAEKLDNTERSLTIDVVPLLSQYTLHSICETAMGTKLDQETTDAGRIYKEAIYNVGKTLVDRFSKVYLMPDFIFNATSTGKSHAKSIEIVHSFTKRVIKDRKEFVEKNGIRLNEKYIENEQSDEEIYMYNRKNKIAMLDLLITAEKDGLIDNQGIQEEVDTFMFEGHDTIASGLVYLLMLLANDMTVQNRVVAELIEIFGNSKRSATMQDLAKMKYLDCCIKESLRLYPPVHFIGRALNNSVILSGYEIPAGTACHIHIFDLHRREDLFKDALKFNPDRFLPENSVGRHPFSYIPFSAGPRNCIGQKFAMIEMKSAVSTLLKKFELHPVTKPEEVELKSDIVLRNKGPVYVKFVKRNLYRN